MERVKVKRWPDESDGNKKRGLGRVLEFYYLIIVASLVVEHFAQQLQQSLRL